MRVGTAASQGEAVSIDTVPGSVSGAAEVWYPSAPGQHSRQMGIDRSTFQTGNMGLGARETRSSTLGLATVGGMTPRRTAIAARNVSSRTVSTDWIE